MENIDAGIRILKFGYFSSLLLISYRYTKLAFSIKITCSTQVEWFLLNYDKIGEIIHFLKEV